MNDAQRKALEWALALIQRGLETDEVYDYEQAETSHEAAEVVEAELQALCNELHARLQAA